MNSEHSAIFQCLNDSNFHNLDFITLTSSGGPFLNKNIKEFKNIKLNNAFLKHPIWKMGKKFQLIVQP